MSEDIEDRLVRKMGDWTLTVCPSEEEVDKVLNFLKNKEYTEEERGVILGNYHQGYPRFHDENIDIEFLARVYRDNPKVEDRLLGEKAGIVAKLMKLQEFDFNEACKFYEGAEKEKLERRITSVSRPPVDPLRYEKRYLNAIQEGSKQPPSLGGVYGLGKGGNKIIHALQALTDL